MSLHYSFPRAEKKAAMLHASREGQINRNLEFSIADTPSSQIAKEPYVKTFSCSNPNTPESLIILSIADPIDDIFQESHRQISEFQMKLPGNSESTDNSAFNNDTKNDTHDTVSKNGFDGLDLQEKMDIKKVQLTPVRKPDPKTPVKSRRMSISEDSFDPLACHADNIMRMAMDSTLAHSFLSNFSNLMDETHLEKSRRFPGFSERSIVEISAADLESAVNDPFRL